MDALRNIYHYHRLEPLIATAGQPSAEEIFLIAQQGYQLVINLALEDAEYSLHNEQELVTEAGMLYAQRPVAWSAPTAEDLEWFFTIMHGHADSKKFIHCAANMRVSVFMALYRMIKHGWDYVSAMQDVFFIWQPNETWQAFMRQRMSEHELIS